MTAIVHIPSHLEFKSGHDAKYEFKKDVQIGLEKPNKQISSKYLYDDMGCRLFGEITRHPDYYLSHCEIEILNFHKKRLSKIIGKDYFNLIELGPGEGLKTKILIDQFMQDALLFKYIPIDVSDKYLKILIKQFNNSKLELTPVHADYFSGLDWISLNSKHRNVVLFLGSNIGNFDLIMVEKFLNMLWTVLKNGDYVLLGFDLRKPVDVLMRAHNDSNGNMMRFKLNLLQRINRELDANFNLDKFQYYIAYNVYATAMESYFISLEPQTVNIRALDQSFQFGNIEPIHIEYAYKYSVQQIEKMAARNGFKLMQNFIDSQEYFVDSLWRVKK